MKKPFCRIFALLISVAFLLSATGCMPVYLFSELVDPDGTFFDSLKLSASASAPSPEPNASAPKTPEITASPMLQPTVPPAADVPNPSPISDAKPQNSVEPEAPALSFSYERPDTDAMYGMIDSLSAELDAGSTDCDDLMARYDALMDAFDHLDSECSLAYVLYARDVTNARYLDEYDALTQIITEMDLVLTEVAIRLFEYDVTGEAMLLAYGEDYRDCVYLGLRLNSREIQPLFDRERKLTAQYDELLTSFTLEDKGTSYTLDDITALADSNYSEYNRLFTAYFAAFNQKAGVIFLELLSIRNEIAATLGYDSYTDYCYTSYMRDYSPEDAAALHTAVKEYICPVYKNALMMFYVAGGLDETSDISVSKPVFFSRLEKALSSVSPDALDALNYLKEHDLVDDSVSDKKIETSFTTYFEDRQFPYIFCQWEDNVSSAQTFIHELGHFTNFLKNPFNGWSKIDSLDLSETDSQGLELLMLRYYGLFFGDSSRVVYYNMLINAMYALVTGCMEDEFQQAVYAAKDITLEQMNEIYLKLAKEYGLLDLYGYTGTEWAAIPHTFQSPLYYISYAVGVVPSLELWELSDNDPSAAAEVYRSILYRRPFAKLRETVQASGLSDPLSAETIQRLSTLLSDTFKR